MNLKPEHRQKAVDDKKPLYHNIFEVCVGVLSFYFVILLYDAKGIYYWSRRLPVNEWSKALTEVSYDHWKKMAYYGFEEPKYTLETKWLDLQGAHALLYPKKFEISQLAKQDRILKEKDREKQWAMSPEKEQLFKESREVTQITSPKGYQKGARTLIIGDSLMMTVGPVLKEAVEKNYQGHVTLRAKLATGLARPDVFDWSQEVDQLAAGESFAMTIVLMGTNDSQDFLDQGEVLTYGTSLWVDVYRQRVKNFIDKICKVSKKALWVGLPPMQSQNFQKKSMRLNHWVLRAAEESHCMEYLDSTKILGNDKGQFESYKSVEGKAEKIRMVDGIHITKKGAQFLVKPILSKYHSLFDLAH